MSALPPTPTAKADVLLYTGKRTCAVQLTMSAMGQKRTSYDPSWKTEVASIRGPHKTFANRLAYQSAIAIIAETPAVTSGSPH
jgi:hypothetical protein